MFTQGCSSSLNDATVGLDGYPRKLLAMMRVKPAGRQSGVNAARISDSAVSPTINTRRSGFPYSGVVKDFRIGLRDANLLGSHQQIEILAQRCAQTRGCCSAVKPLVIIPILACPRIALRSSETAPARRTISAIALIKASFSSRRNV